MANFSFVISLTPDKFETFKQQLLDKGMLTLDTPLTGTLSTQGVMLGLTGVEDNNGNVNVTIEVKNKPFFIPVSLIENQVKSLIQN